MMKLSVECCDRRYEMIGNKIDAESNDDFEFYINDNGKMVVECTRCNNRIRIVDGLVDYDKEN